jgi:hypothetical protein
MHTSYHLAHSRSTGLHRILTLILLALLIAIATPSARAVHATEAEVDDYEVWLTDQNNTASA